MYLLCAVQSFGGKRVKGLTNSFHIYNYYAGAGANTFSSFFHGVVFFIDIKFFGAIHTQQIVFCLHLVETIIISEQRRWKQ
jgi:hypothetical protein